MTQCKHSVSGKGEIGAWTGSEQGALGSGGDGDGGSWVLADTNVGIDRSLQLYSLGLACWSSIHNQCTLQSNQAKQATFQAAVSS